MTNRFTHQPNKVQKLLQMLAKRLATKLAILFQVEDGEKREMQRSPHQETSLFSPSGIRKYLNAAERRRFLAAVETLPARKRLFCIVLLWTGARVSEILALTPNAIDLDSGNVVLRTLKRRHQGIVREVPLPRAVIRAVSSEFCLPEALLDPKKSMQRIWPWSRTTAWRLVKKVMRDASVANLAASPKSLRHTFGVSAFQASVPPHLVQRWLGHASLRTTTIYADVMGKEERQFASRMWRKT